MLSYTYMWSKDKEREYHRRYRKDNIEKRRQWNRDWIIKNRDRYNASKYRYRDRLKLEVLRYYGNGIIKCATCPFDNIDALCLDHIENDGAAHRRALKIGGRNLPPGMRTYEALKLAGYPTGLQILCANCNMIKELERKRAKRRQNPFYAD